jgi:hypothetical protein
MTTLLHRGGPTSTPNDWEQLVPGAVWEDMKQQDLWIVTDPTCFCHYEHGRRPEQLATPLPASKPVREKVLTEEDKRQALRDQVRKEKRLARKLRERRYNKQSERKNKPKKEDAQSFLGRRARSR